MQYIKTPNNSVQTGTNPIFPQTINATKLDSQFFLIKKGFR